MTAVSSFSHKNLLIYEEIKTKKFQVYCLKSKFNSRRLLEFIAPIIPGSI